MIHSSTPPEPDGTPEKSGAGVDRVKPPSDGDGSGTAAGAAKELLDVVDSAGDLLRTIDFDRILEIVDVEELPALVDLDHLSEAVAKHDPDLAVDLSNLGRVIDERELWNSVDLLELAKAKKRLDRELGDVLEDGLPSGGGSEAGSDVKEYVTSLRPNATQAMLQQEALAKIAVGRDALVELHPALERRFESNDAQFGGASDRRTGRNPTAVSLHPRGPLADSVSTRLSTVPTEVPYSKITALPRIYGRRWKDAGTEASSPDRPSASDDETPQG